MQASVKQDFASLLASTQELLDCAEPSLAAWQVYAQRRNELFERIQNITAIGADSVTDSSALSQLMVSVLEQDELLAQKIRRQLSTISHEMNQLKDRRRLFNAYVLAAESPHSSHIHTA